MSKRLRDNISSAYFEAANRLNSKSARRKIVAYVESYDDVFFWRSILSSMETDRLYFEVMLPSRMQHLNRGKKAALMSMLSGKTGENLIACVDADYDYLEQGATATSKEVCSNPYVFHTYAYAIENLQCYAPALRDVCVAVTLNDRQLFDFKTYLMLYSRTVYPLFVWSIMFYRTSRYGEFTLSDFLHVIDMSTPRMNRIDEALNHLRHKVTTRVHLLEHKYPQWTEAIPTLKKDLERLGVTPDNTYLYIQGHHLFNNVVLPIMQNVCDKLVRQRENEIAAQSVHGTQRRNELSCYESSVSDITNMLKKNLGYLLSPQVRQIREDLQNYISQIS